jgi:hypothetical protein
MPLALVPTDQTLPASSMAIEASKHMVRPLTLKLVLVALIEN